MKGPTWNVRAAREPRLPPAPQAVRGFRIRIELLGSEPPVWRRVEVAGDLTLTRLHDVVQAAMGWGDEHAHCFRTEADPLAPRFLTGFEVAQGDSELVEDAVRLDQVVAAAGDRIWYDYDFGDRWEHVLTVESVLPEPTDPPVCTAGGRACPPEDCGGIRGYESLAEWAHSGFSNEAVPEAFEDQADALDWLSANWHPEVFDLDATNAALQRFLAEPVEVTEDLRELLDFALTQDAWGVEDALSAAPMHRTIEVRSSEADAMIEPFRILLEVVGDGVDLTRAGYLKSAEVVEIAERTGVTT